jgi:hypothetical protein
VACCDPIIQKSSETTHKIHDHNYYTQYHRRTAKNHVSYFTSLTLISESPPSEHEGGGNRGFTTTTTRRRTGGGYRGAITRGRGYRRAIIIWIMPLILLLAILPLYHHYNDHTQGTFETAHTNKEPPSLNINPSRHNYFTNKEGAKGRIRNHFKSLMDERLFRVNELLKREFMLAEFFKFNFQEKGGLTIPVLTRIRSYVFSHVHCF